MFVASARTVFVQPHYDDVALSCGGTVAECAVGGEPIILTVFGGEPTSEESDFAQFQRERWQLEEGSAITARRAEDRCAAAVLGDTVTAQWLEYLDAIYRDDRYSDDSALFGAPVTEDLSLVDRITDDLRELGDRFAMPLAIGSHVDHQLLFLAAVQLRTSGSEVWLYPDLPYALDPVATAARLRQLGNPKPCLRKISEERFEQRWRAIECYRSQLPVLFRDLSDPGGAFRAFWSAGTDSYAVEPFWRMVDIEGLER